MCLCVSACVRLQISEYYLTKKNLNERKITYKSWRAWNTQLLIDIMYTFGVCMYTAARVRVYVCSM